MRKNRYNNSIQINSHNQIHDYVYFATFIQYPSWILLLPIIAARLKNIPFGYFQNQSFQIMYQAFSESYKKILIFYFNMNALNETINLQ